MGGLGAYAICNVATVGQLTDQAIDAALVSISDARAASVDFNAVEVAMARSRTLPHQAGLQPRIDSLLKLLDRDLAALAERAATPQAAQAAADARVAVVRWRVAEGLNAAETSDENRTGALARTANRQLERLINYAAGDGLQLQERARATLLKARSRLLLGTCLALALGALVAAVLARQIVVLIGNATDAAGGIAAGRLYARTRDACTDECNLEGLAQNP